MVLYKDDGFQMPFKGCPLEILSKRVTKTRTYLLVRVSLEKTDTITRRRLLEEILEENGVIGLIEWWNRGSIVNKPKRNFDSILILENSAHVEDSVDSDSFSMILPRVP